MSVVAVNPCHNPQGCKVVMFPLTRAKISFISMGIHFICCFTTVKSSVPPHLAAPGAASRPLLYG